MIENAKDILADIILKNLHAILRRYSKQALSRIEDQGQMTPQVRKHILDAFNDAYREIVAQKS